MVALRRAGAGRRGAEGRGEVQRPVQVHLDAVPVDPRLHLTPVRALRAGGLVREHEGRAAGHDELDLAPVDREARYAGGGDLRREPGQDRTDRDLRRPRDESAGQHRVRVVVEGRHALEGGASRGRRVQQAQPDPVAAADHVDLHVLAEAGQAHVGGRADGDTSVLTMVLDERLGGVRQQLERLALPLRLEHVALALPGAGHALDLARPVGRVDPVQSHLGEDPVRRGEAAVATVAEGEEVLGGGCGHGSLLQVSDATLAVCSLLPRTSRARVMRGHPPTPSTSARAHAATSRATSRSSAVGERRRKVGRPCSAPGPSGPR